MNDESRLIGSILSDDVKKKLQVPFSLERSSSAPPVISDFKSGFENDSFAADPEYYAYYHENRALNPRLAHPLRNEWQNSLFAQNSSQSSNPQSKHRRSNVEPPSPSITTTTPNGATNASKDASDVRSPSRTRLPDDIWSNNSLGAPSSQSKPYTSIVDKIQQNFPRTPSPVYRANTDEEQDYIKSSTAPNNASSSNATSSSSAPGAQGREDLRFYGANGRHQKQSGASSNSYEDELVSQTQGLSLHQQQQQQHFPYHHHQMNFGYPPQYMPSAHQPFAPGMYGQHHQMPGYGAPPPHHVHGMPHGSHPQYALGPYGGSPPPSGHNAPQHQQPSMGHHPHNGAPHHGASYYAGHSPPQYPDQYKGSSPQPYQMHTQHGAPPYANMSPYHHPHEMQSSGMPPQMQGRPMYPGAWDHSPSGASGRHAPHHQRQEGRRYDKSRRSRGDRRGGHYRHHHDHDSGLDRKGGRHFHKNKNHHQSNHNRSELMTEFKRGSRKLDLRDIKGYVVEFSRDQHGSRFIQQKLENASMSDKETIFQEILPEALSLMTDVFGNYVIQKFFEFGNKTQKKKLANELKGHVLELTLQTYGCRVIQKALEVIDAEDQNIIAEELQGQVIKCVLDQNGNHVIQKCIERMGPARVQFIVDSFSNQIYQQSLHAYGCRVIQRMLENCTDSQTKPLLDEILGCIPDLVMDQYGNYVVQHVLQHGKDDYRASIINALKTHFVAYSTDKYASNVVEKSFQYGNPSERDLVVDEITSKAPPGQEEPIFVMMKDQFANFVIQKIIESSTDAQREKIVDAIKPHLGVIRRMTYGKHILTSLPSLPSGSGDEDDNAEVPPDRAPPPQ